eukprot:jgi/Mesvir1/22428/Mv17903-RA.1
MATVEAGMEGWACVGALTVAEMVVEVAVVVMVMVVVALAAEASGWAAEGVVKVTLLQERAGEVMVMVKGPAEGVVKGVVEGAEKVEGMEMVKVEGEGVAAG